MRVSTEREWQKMSRVTRTINNVAAAVIATLASVIISINL